MLIYLTTNNIKGKVYVGKYCGKSKSYLGSGVYVTRAIKKYGKKNFSRITLENGITDHDYLCEREIYWIEFYDSTNPEIGYNICKGGRGRLGTIPWNKGVSPSEETRKKIAESQKGENNNFYGKNHSEKTIEIMSETHKGKNHPMYGKHHSEETCKKISEALSGKNNPNYGMCGKDSPNYGKHHTEETCKKISEANSGENHPMYGKHHSEETRKKMRENHADQSGENGPMYGKHHTEEACKKISDASKGRVCSEEICKKMSDGKKGEKNGMWGKIGKDNPNTIRKETVLDILELLNKGLSVIKIVEKVGVSRSTIYKIKNGDYDDIYNLSKKTK